MNNGHVFILSGPSGVGKTTFQQRLLETNPDLDINVIPRYTNRDQRQGEVHGFEYIFTNEDGILRKLFSNDFIHIEKWGDFYQAIETSSISETINNGKVGIVLASTFGAARLQSKFGKDVTNLYMWTGNKVSLMDPNCLGCEVDEIIILKKRIRKKLVEEGFSDFERKSRENDEFIENRMIDNKFDIAAVNGRLRSSHDVMVFPNLQERLDDTVELFLTIVRKHKYICDPKQPPKDKLPF